MIAVTSTASEWRTRNDREWKRENGNFSNELIVCIAKKYWNYINEIYNQIVARLSLQRQNATRCICGECDSNGVTRNKSHTLIGDNFDILTPELKLNSIMYTWMRSIRWKRWQCSHYKRVILTRIMWSTIASSCYALLLTYYLDDWSARKRICYQLQFHFQWSYMKSFYRREDWVPTQYRTVDELSFRFHSYLMMMNGSIHLTCQRWIDCVCSWPWVKDSMKIKTFLQFFCLLYIFRGAHFLGSLMILCKSIKIRRTLEYGQLDYGVSR